jgi:hypothetical protein
MRTTLVDVCLPTHPTLRHPRTGEPLRAVGVGRRGPIWPVLGGDGTGDGTGDGGQQGGQGGGQSGGTGDGQGAGGQSGSGGTGGQGAGQQGAAGTGAGGQSGSDTDNADRGYPANTPVADMNAAQQAAYWKFHARKHEGAFKGLGLTPGQEAAELERLRADAADLQKRKDAELSDVERLTKERDEFAVKAQELQIAQIRTTAAATAGLPADMAQFITAVEADKAKEQAETLKARLAPAGPAGGHDQGYRRQAPTSGAAAGLAEAQRRGFVKPAQNTNT